MGIPDPVAFQIGPIEVRWYGLLIVVGAALGGVVAAWLARRRGDNPDHIWNMLPVALILGIIGARLYHVFSSPAGGPVGWQYYQQNPLEIIAFWRGGLQGFGIFGAVAGGFLGMWVYCRLARLDLLRWLDYAAPGLILAQAIGRWGNYFNQELYGPPTDLPWGIYIEPANRLAGLGQYERFHPVFLYESIANLLVFGVLVALSLGARRRLRDGDVFFAYLIGYGIVRFALEFLRPDAWRLGAIAAAQVVALIAILIGVLAIVSRHRSRPATTT